MEVRALTVERIVSGKYEWRDERSEEAGTGTRGTQREAVRRITEAAQAKRKANNSITRAAPLLYPHAGSHF